MISVLLQLTSAGADTGPFEITSDGETPAFSVVLGTVSKAALTAGVTIDVEDDTTTVRVTSTGTCTNSKDILIDAPTPTTTTTSTTIAPVPQSFDALYTSIGSPVCDGTSATIYTTTLTPDVGDVFYTNVGLTTPWNLGAVVYIESLGLSYFVNVANGVIVSSGAYSCTTTTTTTATPITVNVGNTSTDVIITGITIDGVAVSVETGSFPVATGESLTATISNTAIGTATPISVTFTTIAGGQSITVDTASPLCYATDAGSPATYTRDIVLSDVITIAAATGACV